MSHVLVELKVRFLYRLEVLELQLNSCVRPRHTINLSLVCIDLSQRESCVIEITDLSPVPAIAYMIIEILSGEAFDGRQIIQSGQAQCLILLWKNV
jgi:hypothetical protein